MRDLGVSADALLDGSAELPTYQAFYLDREYGDAVRDRAFEDYLRCLDGSPAAAEVPASLADTLRPYQVEGFRWLARLHPSASAAFWPMRWVSVRRCR